MSKKQWIIIWIVTAWFAIAQYQQGIGMILFGGLIGFAIAYCIVRWINHRKAIPKKVKQRKPHKRKQLKLQISSSKTKVNKPKEKRSQVKTERLTSNQRNVPNPPVDLKDIKDYLKTIPSFVAEGKKRINTRTGFPLAKQSSIDRSKAQLHETISFKSDNYYEEAGYSHWMAINDYLLGIELPYLDAGIVAYKQGDWDIAEMWWLSVLDIRPTNVTGKLEIMYRKQQRYKDIVTMYKKASVLAKKYDHLAHDNTYSSFKESAILEEENHKKPDRSVGVKDYPSKIDMDYVRLLQTVPKQ